MRRNKIDRKRNELTFHWLYLCERVPNVLGKRVWLCEGFISKHNSLTFSVVSFELRAQTNI